MKKQEIKVTVAGCAGVGKSTITDIILRALADEGIKVKVSPSVYEEGFKTVNSFYTKMNVNREERIAAVGEKSMVLVDEIQLARKHWK